VNGGSYATTLTKTEPRHTKHTSIPPPSKPAPPPTQSHKRDPQLFNPILQPISTQGPVIDRLSLQEGDKIASKRFEKTEAERLILRDEEEPGCCASCTSCTLF